MSSLSWLTDEQDRAASAMFSRASHRWRQAGFTMISRAIAMCCAWLDAPKDDARIRRPQPVEAAG